MARPKKYNSKELTNHLREMAAEVHDVLMDGTVQTRGEALASLLWQKALGYTEKKVDDEGKEVEIVHEPAAWALQMVYERMEGRTPQALSEDETRMKVADKVRELAKNRLNAMAKQTVGGDTPPPPSYKKKPDAK